MSKIRNHLPQGLHPIGLNFMAAAEFIGYSPNTFKHMVDTGVMPSPRVYGARRTWIVDELAMALRKLPKANENSSSPECDNGLKGWDD
jgi:hypothetical protein